MLLLALAFFITPFIILSYFNYPGAEDYAEVVILNEFGFFGYVKELYLTWDGRYFSAILFGIHPLKFNSFLLYKIVPVILFGLLGVGIFILLKKLEIFKSNLTLTLCFSFLIFILCLFKIPSICWTFYYYISSTIYITPIIGSLFLAISIINVVQSDVGIKKLISLSISCLLIYAVAGSSELFLGITLLIFSLLFLFDYYTSKGNLKEYSLFVLTILSAAYIHLSAPGITAHFDLNPIPISFDYFLSALKVSLSISNKSFIDFTTGNYLLYGTSIIYSLAFFSYVNTKLKFKISTLELLIISITLIFSIHLLAFPYYWSLGADTNQYPSRLFSLIYIVFIFTWFIILHLILCWIENNTKFKPFSLSFVKLSYMSVALIIITAPLSPVWKIAMSDLISGRAYAYYLEQEERIKLFNLTDENSKVLVYPTNNKPETIYSFVDLEPYRGSGWNTAYEEYFQVGEIALYKNH